MSKKTTDTEKKGHSYELEVLGIVEALKKFRHYLLGIPFKIVTGCQAFTRTMDRKDPTPKIARRALYLQNFDCTVEHRSGQRMQHCDALSRNYYFVIALRKKQGLTAITLLIQNEFIQRVARAQQDDEYLQTLMTVLQAKPYKDFHLVHDVIYKEQDGKRLLVIPSQMAESIIRKTHDNGHFAVKKTMEVLNNDYWIPNLQARVERCIWNCIPCILTKKKGIKQECWLHLIDKGDRPLCTYHIDYVGPLENMAKKYKYLLVIIDAFSKFTWIYPTKTLNNEEVIDKFEAQSISFGNPSVIISDRSGAFTSQLFEDYCSRVTVPPSNHDRSTERKRPG